MLKVGIIGCGKITEVRHAPEYSENPRSEIMGYYDFMPQRAEAMAALYGGKVFDSVEALLASGVDAVSVCVANAEHASVTIQALEAGAHVLCEKPMANTLAECEAMVAAAEKHNLQLMIGQNQRFMATHIKCRELVAAGAIGKVISFRTTFGHPGPEGWTGDRNSWFFDKSRAAFGAMSDLGIHKTDLIHYLLGERVVAVNAITATLDKKYPDGRAVDVDDNAIFLYRTDGGAVGTAHVSWTFYGNEDNSTILYGTTGILRCYSDPTCSLILERPDGSCERMELDRITSNKELTGGGRVNTGVIDSFVNALCDNKPVPVPGHEVMNAMRVVFAADKASRTGNMVNIY